MAPSKRERDDESNRESAERSNSIHATGKLELHQNPGDPDKPKSLEELNYHETQRLGARCF